MNTLEIQQLIIDRCHTASACQPEFKRLIGAKDSPVDFVKVLLDNHSWSISKKIYDAELLQQFDAEILLRAGLPTMANTPIEFVPTEIGGSIWMPYNQGATPLSPYGDHFTFDEARATPHAPTTEQHVALYEDSKSMFAIYDNVFGRLFTKKRSEQNNIFLPAAGWRHPTDGSLDYVGTGGVYWSSSISSASAGLGLGFAATGVGPQTSNARTHGFTLRCVQ